MERQHTSSHEKDAGKGRQVCGQVEGLVEVVNHAFGEHASPLTNHLHGMGMSSDPGSSTATTPAHRQGRARHHGNRQTRRTRDLEQHLVHHTGKRHQGIRHVEPQVLAMPAAPCHGALREGGKRAVRTWTSSP